MINLRPQSGASPLEISPEDYDRLVKKTDGGWSQCEDETEWLAKLHYLRNGLKEKKLTPDQFAERELRLITEWARKNSL